MTPIWSVLEILRFDVSIPLRTSPGIETLQDEEKLSREIRYKGCGVWPLKHGSRGTAIISAIYIDCEELHVRTRLERV